MEATAHAFTTSPGDHAETPLRAYAHLAPFLRRLAKRLKKTPETLLIYDPFYCEGKMVRMRTDGQEEAGL
jgi:hypothetical protein